MRNLVTNTSAESFLGMSLFLVASSAYVAAGLVSSGVLFYAASRTRDHAFGFGLGLCACTAPLTWPVLVGVLSPLVVRGHWQRRTTRRRTP